MISSTWVPATLAGCSAWLAVAAVGTRVDRRVGARLAALADSNPDTDRPGTFLGVLGQSALGVCLRPGVSQEDATEDGRGRWLPEEVAGMRAVALLFGVALVLVSAVLWPPAGVAALLAIPAAYRVPDILIARRNTARREAIDRTVVELVELLLAAVEAGLPPAAAVERSTVLLRGPLGIELDRVGREISLGVDWRVALEQASFRTQSDSLGRLVVSLGRAHRLGTSPRASLRALAAELRAERRAHAEELARRAPVKMLFPLVFLILPAFLLLTVGPVVLATIRSLH